MSKRVVVNDKMQTNYSYELVAPIGQLADNFRPNVTPKQMLELGVFGGKYMTDCRSEFPEDWFVNAKLSPSHYNTSLNHFGVIASKPLQYWIDAGWIRDEDPRGWFQWYCRYYMGRRIAGYDEWQITRWRNIKRHLTYILNRFDVADVSKTPAKRQALLHWAVLVDGSMTPDQLRNMFI